MSDILSGAADLDDGAAKNKEEMGPWLSAWHDPVAGLECNAGCMQVQHVHIK